METIILPSPSLYGAVDGPLISEKASGARPRLVSFNQTRDQSISWGRRHHHGSWLHALGCLSIMLCCPILVIYLWVSLQSFGGSLTGAWDSMVSNGPVAFFHRYGPRPDGKSSLGYIAWLLFQAALYQFLPSKLSTGQLTPAGNLLKYRTNGLLAWAVTHILFGIFAFAGYIDPAILARNWEGLLVSANVFGFLLSGIAYAKACLAHTHEGDRTFRGGYPRIWLKGKY